MKSNVEPDGALVRALIRYDSQTKELFVLVSYPGSSVNDVMMLVSHISLN